MTVPVAVFASGSGTNLQALLDHESTSQHYRVRLVVSDRSGAGALDRARRADRRTEVIPVSDRDPGEVAADTLELLEAEEIVAVFLAGYLQLVPAAVVDAYRGRILNIHPALLPAFGGEGMYGPHVHRAVLGAGARVSGVTVHHVDEDYDRGRIFAQWPVPVRSDDTPETLAARVLEVEHVLYPLAADHLCRALAEDRDPPAFDPHGEVYRVADDGSDGETARQIRRAFQPK